MQELAEGLADIFHGVLSKISGLLCRLPNVDFLADALRTRRQKLQLIDTPVIGQDAVRAIFLPFFPFRASSHFLYFATLRERCDSPEAGQLTLFMDDALQIAPSGMGNAKTRGNSQFY